MNWLYLDGFPSGQRGQTVNLLATLSVVRIHPHPFYGVLAQLGEHLPYKQRVIGSSPIGPILNIIAGWSSPVARWAHNPKVTGSNPVPAIRVTAVLKECELQSGSLLQKAA